MNRGLRGGHGGPVVALVGLLLLVLALGALGATVAGGPEEDLEPVLYFTERPLQPSIDRWNFSTLPPDGDDAGRDRQGDQGVFPNFVADWTWYLPAAPSDWSVAVGTTWRIVFHMEGLDEVVPLPDPSSAATWMGGHDVRVTVASSETEYARGTLHIPAMEVEPGVQPYEIALSFEDAHTFVHGGGFSRLQVHIEVTGRGEDAESPLRLHFGSQQHPSRLQAEGYPVASLREMELLFLAEQDCLGLLLQQRTCQELQDNGDGGNGNGPGPQENGNGTGDGDGTTKAPAPGFVVMVAGIGVLIAALRGRKSRPG